MKRRGGDSRETEIGSVWGVGAWERERRREVREGEVRERYAREVLCVSLSVWMGVNGSEGCMRSAREATRVQAERAGSESERDEAENPGRGSSQARR